MGEHGPLIQGSTELMEKRRLLWALERATLANARQINGIDRESQRNPGNFYENLDAT